MPIRIASVKKKIVANGQALHRAMMARTEGGAGPSEEEAALLEERRQLKDEKAKRASGVVKGTYDKLRGIAKKNVEAAVPRLGRLIAKHTA